MNFFLQNIAKKAALFLFIYLFFIMGVFIWSYNHKTDYPAAIKGKYERLDSLKNEQKMIICGGSSSAYGFDSKELSSTINLPVVNTTLAMSLGSFFHTNMVKSYLNKGDVVLYIPEYEFYYGRELGDDFLYTTIFYYPQMIKDFTSNQQQKTLINVVRLSVDFYKKLIINFIKNKKETHSTIKQYNRESYNFIGDNISLIHITNTVTQKEETTRYARLKIKKISSKFAEKLSSFATFCKKRGAIFLIGFPPLESSQFDNRFTKDIIPFLKSKKIKYIGMPKNYVYKLPFFYDTSYHLNGLGRIKRTEQLIKDLKGKL